MAARLRPVWWASVLAVAGCVGEEGSLPLVSSNPFGAPPGVRMPERPKASPASEEAALRVTLVGQKVLAANKEAGLHPVFHTVGVPAPEIFHHATSELYVTEGLTKRCKTDEQLAAVLAVEMGKMVAEREALARPEARRPQKRPPQEARVGGDFGGTFGPPDGTRLAELGKFEKEGGRPDAPLPPPPDPTALARSYLARAGYGDRALDEAAPILKEARAHVDLERQMTPTGRPSPLTGPPGPPRQTP